MRVLVLGGTGAMGNPLCNLLATRGIEVTSVSRTKPLYPNEKVNYVHGNAYDTQFQKNCAIHIGTV